MLQRLVEQFTTSAGYTLTENSNTFTGNTATCGGAIKQLWENNIKKL